MRLRHLEGVHTPIFKTHYSITDCNSKTHFMLTEYIKRLIHASQLCFGEQQPTIRVSCKTRLALFGVQAAWRLRQRWQFPITMFLIGRMWNHAVVRSRTGIFSATCTLRFKTKHDTRTLPVSMETAHARFVICLFKDLIPITADCWDRRCSRARACFLGGRSY